MSFGNIAPSMNSIWKYTVKNKFWEMDTYPAIAGYLSSYSWMSILMVINPAISG